MPSEENGRHVRPAPFARGASRVRLHRAEQWWRRSRVLLPAVLFFCHLALPTDSAAESLYVQSAKAKLMSQASFRSEVLLYLSRGDKVERLESRSDWVLVQSGPQKGFIPSLLLGKEPPRASVSMITDKTRLGKAARRRASSVPSAAASRGHAESAPNASDARSPADRATLEAIVAIADGISEADLEAFIGGRVGDS